MHAVTLDSPILWAEFIDCPPGPFMSDIIDPAGPLMYPD